MRISDHTKRMAVAEVNAKLAAGSKPCEVFETIIGRPEHDAPCSESSYYKWRKQFGMYPATKTPEHAPVLPTPPEGYEIIGPDENVKEGDKCWQIGKWYDSRNIGKKQSERCRPYCRPVGRPGIIMPDSVDSCPGRAAKDAKIAAVTKEYQRLGEMYGEMVDENKTLKTANAVPTEPLARLAWYAAGFAATRREIMDALDKADNDLGK